MSGGMRNNAAILTIRGRVQGVGYRWWATQMARRLALRGWVRNRTDGSVEILAIGAEPNILAMVDACHEGPAAAQVASVQRAGAEDDGSPAFDSRPTA